MDQVRQDHSGLALGLCLNRTCAVSHGLLIEDVNAVSHFCPFCSAGVIHECPNCHKNLLDLGFTFEFQLNFREWPNYCRLCNEPLYLPDSDCLTAGGPVIALIHVNRGFERN